VYYWFSRSIDLKREEAVIQHIEKTSPQYTTGEKLSKHSLPVFNESTPGR
jgi:NCS1 family nucleobase:cation symporter-1